MTQKWVERLLKLREITPEGHWLYTGFVAPNGYAQYCGVLVHVLGMLQWGNEDIPQGYHVHHKCDKKHCFNPEHLKVLSPAEHAAEHARLRSMNAH